MKAGQAQTAAVQQDAYNGGRQPQGPGGHPRPFPDHLRQCDIIIPVFNNIDDTRVCLEHIRANTGPPYRLILVDDCSESHTANWLANVAQGDKYGPALLVRREAQGGWTGATNAGLEKADAPFICLMNNDTLAAPGWLDRLLYHFGRQSRLGLLQPTGNEAEIRKAAEADLKGLAADLAAQDFGLLMRSSYISGFCLLMRRSLYRALGPFDESFAKGLWADHDYCRKAQDMGLFSAVARDALVLHLQGRTMGRRSEAVRQANLSAERIFISRWGYKQGVYWKPNMPFAVPDAAPQMEKLYRLADRGNMFYVALDHREKPDQVLAAHGLPSHSNVKFETTWLVGAARQAWAAYRYRYQRHKNRVRVLHCGNLAGLDLRCRPLDALPPEKIGIVYRGK